MANRLHAPPSHPRMRKAWRLATRAAVVPGLDGLLSYGAHALFTPERGERLSVRANPAAGDLFRQAFADVPGNSSLARSWAKCARSWPRGRSGYLLERYASLDMPVLLLWADRDRLHPLTPAEEALGRAAAGPAEGAPEHRLPDRLRRPRRPRTRARGLLRIGFRGLSQASEPYTRREDANDKQLWGGETAKAVENFPISGETVPVSVIRWLARLKGAAAAVNGELGLLEAPAPHAIEKAAAEIAAGKHDEQFPIDVFQTGSGTSTNTNANEVIARSPARACTPTTTSTWASPQTTSSPPRSTWPLSTSRRTSCCRR